MGPTRFWNALTLSANCDLKLWLSNMVLTHNTSSRSWWSFVPNNFQIPPCTMKLWVRHDSGTHKWTNKKNTHTQRINSICPFAILWWGYKATTCNTLWDVYVILEILWLPEQSLQNYIYHTAPDNDRHGQIFNVQLINLKQKETITDMDEMSTQSSAKLFKASIA